MEIHEKVEAQLKKAGVNYKFIPLPENLPPDIASHMAFHHDTMDHAMATIIYGTENGLIAAVKRADTDIDENKLKALAGVAKLSFASEVDLKSLGVDVNIVPYLGLEIPYFVDAKVRSVGKVYGTPGSKTIGMVMDSRDMIKVNKGKVGDFTRFIRAINIHGDRRYRIVSGITPSGDGTLHIGNYLGAVKQFIEIAKSNECFLFIADLHALTTIQDKETLKRNTEALILNELSLLGDLNNIVFYRQSDIGFHPELQTILNNVTPLGLLKRAHAYKDKLARDITEEDVNLGLFNYPILMAADILMYQADLVPVGKDQKQHVEITRDVGERFNKIFKKKIFRLPEAYIPEEVAVILGTDGQRKMSKTLGNIISIFDDEAAVRKQVNGVFTDPARKHASDPGHIGGNMVFSYLDHFGEPHKVEELKNLYREGRVGDVQVKDFLFDSLMKTFAPARARYQELKGNPKAVKDILERGTDFARSIAATTMKEVRAAVGLVNAYSFDSSKLKAQSEKIKLPGPENNITGTIISIDEFAKVEIRVGKVTGAENVQKSEKLIRLSVDFGLSAGERTIFTGVRGFGYVPEDFAGKQFLFVVNLAPRKMLDEFSQGMILAVDGLEKAVFEHGSAKPIFISAEGLPLGAKIR